MYELFWCWLRVVRQEDRVRRMEKTLGGKEDLGHGKLLRVMGMWSLALYGVGDMLGAGIYGLIGRAAGQMGNAVWAAFLTSMLAAMLTGLSYASLGSRYPRAAGAAFVVQRAFGLPFLSYLIGLAAMVSGLTSMATASRVFSGYLQGLGVALPLEILALGFILLLTAVNFWGMKESIWLNLLCTLVEMAGLVFIIFIGAKYWGSVNYLEIPPTPSGGIGEWTAGLALQGAVLTFYSFVGFEDMLNVSEEVKDPQRNFPRGVVLALLITTVIYMAIGITAVSVVPYAELAKSGQPLVDVVRRAAPWFPPVAFSFISMFAVTNTALLNYIMGSRLVYGMSRQGLLPKFMGKVHPKRHTPHVAIFMLMVIICALVLSGDISTLAKSTSVLLLVVFVVVNLALIILKRRKTETKGLFEVPIFVPIGGMAICVLMLAHAKFAEIRLAGILLALIAALYVAIKPKLTNEELKMLSE